MNKQQARDLTNQIRDVLTLTGDLLAEVIAAEAWVPLGYDSFTAWWAGELAGVPLAAEMRCAVVYEMFRAGATDADVADAMTGVGEETAASLRQQQENGVPSDAASLRPPRRRPVGERKAYDRHIDIVVTEDEYETIAAIAGPTLTVHDWALALVRKAIVDADITDLDQAS